ncbi:MAG: primosomal protein N' [Planctomycetes bacterium]|nr:primosomal protein N' [Planctomycetota bacterium]
MDTGADSLFPASAEEAPAAPSAPVGGYAQVALRKPLRTEFTYAVPAELAGRVRPGMRVAVPFGSRREVGVVVELRAETDVEAKRVRKLAALLDDEPVLDAGLLELTKWVAGYYACSWGEALGAVLPSSLKREQGVRKVLMISARAEADAAALAELVDAFPKQHRLLRTLLELGAPIELRELTRQLNVSEAPARSLERRGLVTIQRVASSPDPLLASTRERARHATLGADQAAAVDALTARLRAGGYETFLLQGVTGSGKTEVYLRAIEAALELGRGAIVLVPEIALTPQTVGWFRSRFGDVAVLHSRMTDAQRLDMWQRVRRGEVRVVVGARSAVFAPVPELGVIVVDEEHEPSFKQGSSPRYSARDVAVVRASQTGAICVLGSATPSLETWNNAREGRYTLLELRERVGGGTLPRVEVVDMCQEKGDADGPPLFSRRLAQLLEDRLARKQQSILFLNRRGFAPVLWCPGCHETVHCPQCDVSLTFHRRIGRAVCHTCCEEIAPPTACPSCTRPGLKYLGLGSERVESTLKKLLPAARVARMDSDTMRRREDYEETLEAFGRGELDVLVGTQMIAKGLDFPNVTLVGIISADSALHLPDFRAAERTFQLLAQVAGRAGRGDEPGEIVVQTRAPEHPAIVRAAAHDFEGFARAEDELRDELGYPPHGRLVRAVFEDEDEARVVEAAAACAAALREHTSPAEVLVLGPAPAAIAQVRGRHRRHLLLKAPELNAGLKRARSILLRFGEDHPRPRLAIDVDPVSLL